MVIYSLDALIQISDNFRLDFENCCWNQLPVRAAVLHVCDVITVSRLWAPTLVLSSVEYTMPKTSDVNQDRRMTFSITCSGRTCRRSVCRPAAACLSSCCCWSPSGAPELPLWSAWRQTGEPRSWDTSGAVPGSGRSTHSDDVYCRTGWVFTPNRAKQTDRVPTVSQAV